MNGGSPRVFVGVPTLNRPDYVRETVQSVRAQTFGDFRLVVSDNVSAPEVSRSVRQWVEDLADPRVSFHQQPRDVGEYGQGRYFFQAAEEDFFVILHDDDVLEPGYLARAVSILNAQPGVDVFLANPYLMDWRGQRRREETQRYLAEHGRIGRQEGKFELLSAVLEPGTAWISGACFRLSSLRSSGLADDDAEGHYLELNVFLRLAERGGSGWFCAEELFGVRFHAESLRVYNGWDPLVVANSMRILERRRFQGRPERQRRATLAFLHRADALHRLHDGDFAGGRRALWRALRLHPMSPRTWKLAPLGILAPQFLRLLTGGLREARFSAKTDAERMEVEDVKLRVMRGRSRG